MDGNQHNRERAERLFRPADSRPAKDSALGLIAAETSATNAKTAQLKALRMERDAAVRPEPRKAVRLQSTKRVVLR